MQHPPYIKQNQEYQNQNKKDLQACPHPALPDISVPAKNPYISGNGKNKRMYPERPGKIQPEQSESRPGKPASRARETCDNYHRTQAV